MVLAKADAIVASGMRDAGYTYVNIDDGRIIATPQVFCTQPKTFPT
jgi:hypothetical protein